MSTKKLEITILTDKSSWMNQFNVELKKQLEASGHNVNLIHSKKELKKGDVAFLLSCFEIIEETYLELNKHNVVVHASDLPNGKGWSPTTYQIIEGKNNIPITLFEATNSLDGGDYYIKDILSLNGAELIDEWQEKLGHKIIELCKKYIAEYNSIQGKKQNGKETFYKKRTPKDSELNIDKTIKEQFNLLRVVDNENYPAFFYMNKQKYIIKISKDKNDK